MGRFFIFLSRYCTIPLIIVNYFTGDDRWLLVANSLAWVSVGLLGLVCFILFSAVSDLGNGKPITKAMEIWYSTLNKPKTLLNRARVFFKASYTIFSICVYFFLGWGVLGFSTVLVFGVSYLASDVFKNSYEKAITKKE